MATAVHEATTHAAHHNGQVTSLRMADSEKKTFTLNLPLALLEAIREDAKARHNPASGSEGVPDNTVAREILAAHYGFAITDNYSPRLRKGLSKEEKKAQREKTKARISAIVEALSSGKLSDEILRAAGINI